MLLKRLPSWAFTLLALAPPAILLFVPIPAGMAPRLAIIIPLVAWMIAMAGVAWWRLDETGREAHKFAWFWGGALGLLLAQFLAIGALLTPLIADPVVAAVMATAKAGATVESGFAIGVLACAMIQAAGYVLVWAGWWASKRFGR